MDIPDEAVEAAARAAAKDEDASNWDDEHQYYRNGWLNRMQVALEAAAPHLLAAAWDEAADEAASCGWMHDAGTADTKARNPYRKATK